MVGCENQGVMTESHAVLGISTISFKKMASEISEAFFVSVPSFFSNYSIQSTNSYLSYKNNII